MGAPQERDQGESLRYKMEIKKSQPSVVDILAWLSPNPSGCKQLNNS